jgi:hypothetical protein
MNGKKIFFVALFWSIGSVVFAQTKKKDQSTSVESILPQKEYAPKKKKKKSKGSETTYDARNDFYDRQEALNKQRIKNEKSGDNPQYSDPQYFGHKRPPRKRPANKMKFCKVCGIRH